jgi:hypothetical protein
MSIVAKPARQSQDLTATIRAGIVARKIPALYIGIATFAGIAGRTRTGIVVTIVAKGDHPRNHSLWGVGVVAGEVSRARGNAEVEWRA